MPKTKNEGIFFTSLMCFLARRRTVRMQGNLHLEAIQNLVFSNEETELLGTRKANETTTQAYQTQA